MNFLEADISGSAGNLTLAGAGFSLVCDQATEARLASYRGADITLGIRPSDLHFDQNAVANESIELQVNVSEYIGAQSVLIGDCAGAKVMVELKSATPIALGERLKFRVNLSDVHLFDPANGRALV